MRIVLCVAILVFCCLAEDAKVFVPAKLPCDHIVKYEKYCIGGGKRVTVKGKFIVKGRFIAREQEWGDGVEDYMIARSDIQRPNNNKTFALFYGLKNETGYRKCIENGYQTYPSFLSRYFSDYTILVQNITYFTMRKGRFEQKTYDVISSGGIDYYIDKNNYIIGTVKGTNTTQYWYSRGAYMSSFILSKKYKGCNETRIYDNADDIWIQCGASHTTGSIIMLVASALVSLFLYFF